MTASLPVKPRTVLVVEDEFLIALQAVELLEEAGHTALMALDADEAIKILEERSDIDIVFTDVNMPGSMDGLKLARAIRNRWPPVEIIITSARPGPGRDSIPERGVFFPKPYDGDHLYRAILAFQQ